MELTQKKQSILVIEDDKEITEMIEMILGDAYNVKIAHDAKQADQRLAEFEFDLILLDVGLPDTTGWDYLEKIKKDPATELIPVFFITGATDVHDRVRGINLGAEDYILKPFSPPELKARVHMHLQRTKNFSRAILQKGRLRFHTTKMEVRVIKQKRDRHLKVTPNEFKVLLYLASHPNIVVDRETLSNEIWEEEKVSARTIDTHVSALRKKLKPFQFLVKPVYGKGYEFIDREKAIAQSKKEFKEIKKAA